MNIYLSNIKEKEGEKEEKEREKDVTFRTDLKIKILKVFLRKISILQLNVKIKSISYKF